MVNLQLHQSFYWRLVVLAIFFFILLAAVIGRVFSLAIIDHREFVFAAERQHIFAEVLPSNRGTIFVRDKTGALQPIANEKVFFLLAAVPKNITDAPAVAQQLSGLLGIPTEDVLVKLTKQDDPYEVITRKIEPMVAEKIRALGVKGLLLVEEPRRFYPQGTLAANVLGFVSYQDGEERGEYGIEREYQDYLRGERGFFKAEQDAAGYWVAIGRRILNPPVDGDSIVLTIDPQIQFRLERELDQIVEKWKGEMTLGIVVEPKTGKILALASRPSFDPNEFSKETDFSVFRNPAIDSQFELGSVMKPITMAAGIDAKVVTPETTYRDPGTIKYQQFTVSNYDEKSHGVQTMTNVLEKSLNTGAIFVQERLGMDRFLAALKRFGFGSITGIDFPGEVAGDISNLENKREIDYATASFGQGVAVTPLQMAMAIGAIANGGVLMKPYLVERIMDAAGNEEVRGPLEVRRVISPEAAEVMSKMLASVGKVALTANTGSTIPGYHIAGKTGTAQLPNPSGRGYSSEFIHTFVGYGPAFNPRYLILLQTVKPQGVLYASGSLTPAFRSLSEFILKYYDVPPDAPLSQ